ncbi:hypothetical protein BN946_scf185043.g161 [Trametes cinnabarina]|uniref:Uncharacterized protein n=1 Tax=Pycnoporus cinnabarinus TaxID=5643 RepID=A0A060SIS7_PYCCI|nr:hypothetical protein BN946_scf185043.g161 [Trametes cinnabarina]
MSTSPPSPTQQHRMSTSQSIQQRRMSASAGSGTVVPPVKPRRMSITSSQAAQRRMSIGSQSQSPENRRLSVSSRRMSIGAYTLPVPVPDGIEGILGKRRFKPENIPDLSGRTALVTGGTSGIGYFDALELALANAKVIIVSTTASWHGKQTEIDINAALQECESSGSVVWHAIDMSSLKAVDTLAQKIVHEESRLDILICNAGVGQSPFVMTNDGLEKHFEVNNLAHYVFALRLLPLMQRTAAFTTPGSVRIVMQSSELHRSAPPSTKFASKEEINTPMDETDLYARTKLGLIYLTRELARRKLSTYPPGTVPVLAMAVHPGSVDTEMKKVPDTGPIAKIKKFFSRSAPISDEEGAEACLWAATCTDIGTENWKQYQGKYLSEAYGKPDSESPLAKDDNVAQNFWELYTANLATLVSRRFKPEQIPDLTGRVALVTGGSAGIGYHVAAALATHNARVLIASSSAERGVQAEGEINDALKKSGSVGSVTWYEVDFGNLKQVDAFAKRVLAQEDRLDLLILNAGIGQGPYGTTADGLERHFEVNNLAHYVVALRLLPLMQKAAATAPPASVRIVTQSSEMHRTAPSSTHFASKDEVNQDTGGGASLYGRTKLGLILLARELAQRKLCGLPNPILAISVHPGTVDTDLQKTWSESYGLVGKVVEKVSRALGKDADEGAEASLWAATTTDINETNWQDFQGNYYSEPYGKPGQETSQAKDQTIGNNFWKLCADLTEELLGERLE